MTTLDSDNFQRPNQPGWGTASGGSTWAFSGVSETLSITSNEGVEGSLTGGDWHAQLGSTTAATVNLLVRLKVDDTLNFAGVMGRYSSTGGINGYRIGLFSGTLKADKYVTGIRTQIGTSVSFSYTTGQFVWVRAVISGTTITGTAWLDGNSEPGSPQFSTTDSSISAAGKFGLSAFMSSGNNHFDSFIATDNSSVSTKTRTVTTSAALEQTTTRTISASAALKTTPTRSVPESAALKTTNTRSLAASGALKTTSTRTVSASATLANVRTVPCAACLSSTFIFEPNAMLLVPSGQTTLLVPTGQTSLIVPSGQTTLII